MRIMKNILMLAGVSLAGLLAACNSVEPIVDEVTVPAEPATITVTIPEGGLTKVSLTQDPDDPDGSVKTAWESTDIITVKNASVESKSVDFTLKSGEGTKTAVFTAVDASALNGASRYNIYLSSNAPADYYNQTQDSDCSTAHLGYVATLRGVKKYGTPTFSSEWALENGGGSFTSSSVLRVRAQLPSADFADNVKKLTIKASAAIFDGSDELSVSITNPGVEGDGKILTVFATLPAGDFEVPAGTGLLFRFHLSDNPLDAYTAYSVTEAKTFLKAGKVNAFKVSRPNIATSAGINDDGSAENPYLIADRRQMLAMHDLLGNEETKYFRMVDDVDLNGITWIPLCQGASENKKIYFDGDGHTIYNLTAGTGYNYPSFFGFLWGEVSNVIFDGAVITCGDTKEQSGGVISGYMGGSSHAGNLCGITVRNSTITSGGGSAYVGGLAGRVGNSESIIDCHIISSSVSTSTSGTNVGGLISYIASNSALTIADCTAEDIEVTGCGHYAGGLISLVASSNVSIRRCHTTGTVKRTSSGRHFGGLVGAIQSTEVQVVNCYSTCSVTGYQFSGGLIGSWREKGSGTVDHCFASGTISDKGNSGDGGLVGNIEVPGVTISNCVAWNDIIIPNKYGEGNYSSGAVVGRTHPNSRLENNYRRPDMNLTAFWVPSADFDHPNSKKDGDTYYIWMIGADGNEANGGYTTATSISNTHCIWAYHGKHCAPGTVVTPDDRRGWVSPDLGYDPDPDEDPDWNDEPTITLAGATTETLCDGVEFTHFHGTWEGQVREINIIKTRLDEHNSLGVFYDYTTEGRKYLNEKCVYVGAIAGTNGSMACCQFVRVNDVVKHGVTEASYYTSNCALTIDDGDVDIVHVEGNSGAASLPNQTVSCAGPLLVWKGTIQTYPEQNSEDFLKNTHPRTAIGLSKDGKTVIQVTVDGRWTSSNTSRRAIGMSTATLSKLMRGLGCYKAMNFDGGGGTQMWVSGYGDSNNIVNHPHNELPEYGSGTGTYNYNANPAARRTCGSAVYIKRD